MEKLVTDSFKKGELKGIRDGELKGIKETHKSSFLLGYQVWLDYIEVPKGDHRREPPVVPPVQLPNHLPSEQPNPAVDTFVAEA